MKRLSTVLLAAILLAAHAPPARAWDDTGHRLVAQVAWMHLTPTARARVIQLFRNAPDSTGLSFGSPGPVSLERARAQFLHAAIWPDSIRSNPVFSHSSWHFVNIFWLQQTDFSTPIPQPSHPIGGDLLVQLPLMEQTLRDRGADAADRVIALAWIEHLVGDIHQPLHASSRITPVDTAGDRGGNDFKLGTDSSATSLHSFWDHIVTNRRPKRSGESAASYVRRLAVPLQMRFPRTRFTSQLAMRDPRGWAERSVRIAQQSVYRPPLVRNQFPDNAYSAAALQTAEPRIALAGYRLANILNRALR